MINNEKVFYKYRPKHVHVHTYKHTTSPKLNVKRKVYLKMKLYYLLILMSFQTHGCFELIELNFEFILMQLYHSASRIGATRIVI